MTKKSRKNWRKVPLKKSWKRCKSCDCYESCKDWNELRPDYEDCDDYDPAENTPTPLLPK